MISMRLMRREVVLWNMSVGQEIRDSTYPHTNAAASLMDLGWVWSFPLFHTCPTISKSR